MLHVGARVPLDVDLEDKLVYGLTPMRMAYAVVALLMGLALWSERWAPAPVRGAACVFVVGVGATVAWGRWRGRAVDRWLTDMAIFVTRSYRVTWNPRWVRALRRTRERTPPVAILVVGREARAGATTVAVELAACLAAKGDSVELCGDDAAQRLGMVAWGRHRVSGVEVRAMVQPGAPVRWSIRQAPREPGRISRSHLLLSVAPADCGRACYLDRGYGPHAAGLIPEDECVHQAEAINEATVIAFPDAPASRAFRELAEVVAAAA